jgi:hypothetical protein
MNICKPHGVNGCEVCWPGGWVQGLEEAINRLEEHVKARPNTRFDARDRSALRYLLATLRGRN